MTQSVNNFYLPYKWDTVWHHWWWHNQELPCGYLTVRYSVTSLIVTQSLNNFWLPYKWDTVWHHWWWHNLWTTSGYLTRERQCDIIDGDTIPELLLVTLQVRYSVTSLMVAQSLNNFWLPYKWDKVWHHWWWHNLWTTSGYLTSEIQCDIINGDISYEQLLVTLQERDGVGGISAELLLITLQERDSVT